MKHLKVLPVVYHGSDPKSYVVITVMFNPYLVVSRDVLALDLFHLNYERYPGHKCDLKKPLSLCQAKQEYVRVIVGNAANLCFADD